MTRRGTMPKAYLRIDPNLDVAKPGHLAVFVRLLCLASRQPVRGRFKSRRLLEQLLGKSAARRVIDEGDVIPSTRHAVCRDCPDGHGLHGQLYVVGWDEWQEGDHSVGERMHRMRSRRARNGDGTVTPRAYRDRSTQPVVLGSNSSSKALGVGRQTESDEIDPIEAALLRLLRHGPSPRQIETVESFDAQLDKGVTLATIENLVDERPERDAFGVLLRQLKDATAAKRPERNGHAKAGEMRQPEGHYDGLIQRDA